MKVVLGQTLVEGLKPKPKPYEVRDVRLNGLLLRAEAGDTKTYFCEFVRGRRIKLGCADALGASDARDNARPILAEFYRGEELFDLMWSAVEHRARTTRPQRHQDDPALRPPRTGA